MKPDPHSNDDPWETDRVWDLLAQSPPRQPSGSFVDNTVRSARLSSGNATWRGKTWTFGPLVAGLLGAAAALVVSLTPDPVVVPAPTHGPAISSQAREIEEFAETETLLAAVEHMDEFSDSELVSLIGF